MPPATTTTAGPALDDAALDRLIATGGISIPDLTTRRAEFKLHTSAATVGDDTNPDTGNPRVHAIGSSTIKDLQGDTMEPSALSDMCKAMPGLAIFVNHSYQVPEDVVGRLFDYPSTQGKRDVVDLMLDVEILSNVNPRAAQLYAGIKAGVRQGVSIGCMITAAQWVDNDGNVVPDDEVDWWDVWMGNLHLHILGVDPLEWSFVGIPANQRSWTQYAAQGLFRRALRAGDLVNAKRLAPMVRSWFPDDFKDDLLSIVGGDLAFRKELGEVAPRRGDGKQVLWLPDKAQFALRNPQTKRLTTLSRERVGELLAGEAESPDKVAHAGHTASADPETPAATGGDAAVDAEKGASQEEKDAQEARSKKYKIGIKDGGNVTKPGDFADVPDSQWADPVNYRYPMPDKEHADNAASRWGDDDNREQYTQAEQDIITKRIEDRQADFGEDDDDDKDKDKDKDDKATEPDKMVSGTGGDILVTAKGSHAAYKGSHSHAHSAFNSQGGDDNHDHEHSHDGDANHDHHSGSSDSGDADDDSAKSAPTGDRAAATAGVSDATVAEPPKVDPPVVSPGEDQRELDNTGHWAEASVQRAPADGVAKQGIEMPADGAEHTTTLRSEAEIQSDAQRAEMLKTFNQMVAPHGFVVLAASAVATTAETIATLRKCMLVDNDADAQKVVTLVSNLDMYLDQAEQCSDDLMALLKIPDVDEDDDEGDGSSATDPDNSDVAGPRYPAGVSEGASDTLAVRASRLLTRAGARNNAEDRASLQQIHDAVYAMTDGMCCSATEETPEEGGDNANGADTANNQNDASGQSGTTLDDAQQALGRSASVPATLSTLPELLTSFGGVVGALKDVGLPAMEAKVAELTAALAAVKAQQDEIAAAQDRTAHDIARLRGTPLGRPTTQRSVTNALSTDAPIPDVTAESLTPEGQAAEVARQMAAAKAQTTIMNVPGVGSCRVWQEGVGKDVRPDITRHQRMALEMGFAQIRRALPPAIDGSVPTSVEGMIATYKSGGPALIPIVFDGE